MLDTIAKTMDDAFEAMLVPVILMAKAVAKVLMWLAMAVFPPFCIAFGGSLLFCLWGEYMNPLALTIPCGVVILLFGIRMQIDVLIHLRKIVARKYLRQLTEHMREPTGDHYHIRHSWYERRGQRHDVILEEDGDRHAIYVDGKKVGRSRKDWRGIFEALSVLILTDKV